MNAAFKHLEAKLRIGELSVGQWAGVIAGVVFALLFAQYLSPIGGTAGLVLAVYLGAIPAAAAFFASLSDFDLWGMLAAALRRQRRPGEYLPGGGSIARGYTVLAEQARHRAGTEPIDLDGLWD